jgi:chromosome segregation ATPase
MEAILAGIIEATSTLGFPIVCVVALGYFVWHIYKQSVTRETELMGEIKENRRVNEKAIETIALYAERLTHIEDNITEIKTDVMDIKNRI